MVAKSKRKSMVQKVLKSCTFMLLVSVLCQLSEIDLNVTIICSVYTWRKLYNFVQASRVIFVNFY